MTNLYIDNKCLKTMIIYIPYFQRSYAIAIATAAKQFKASIHM